mmetsp:Transcript_23374/g.35544  ORF Transcript_23374/g.35544 Transcript_23374/m.35544 type:complete len:440 (-) Transcript_23374:276-1595(-)|eukprot:CAMPEP_0194085402 /NCGR_PEP_ID=MMETSP0149-20130528/17496_1 /TAXON_ID=122233 /ORGANISM="Chaetoceros debilis, Strain MM31A-1" /LENGTH=439 /DNA_ID=CAMNT_0038768287 /DNA_START=77 /DNA_END=1396 /DNA_ORIENTATION=+
MMDTIHLCYGKQASLYDVLQVSNDASEGEIESAFVRRRYELFHELQNTSTSDAPNVTLTGTNGRIISLTERKFTEKKMDALIAVYRLLSNTQKRREYNLSLSVSRITQQRLTSIRKKNSIENSPPPLGSQKSQDSPDCVSDIPKSFSSKSSTSDHGLNSRLTGELESMVIGIDDSREQASPSIHLATSGPTPIKKGMKLEINPKKILFESPNSDGKLCDDLYSSNGRPLTATHKNDCGVNADLDSSHETEGDLDGDSSVDCGSTSSKEQMSQFNASAPLSDTFSTDESSFPNGCYPESFQQVNDDPKSVSRKTVPTRSKKSQTYNECDSPSRKISWGATVENKTRETKPKKDKFTEGGEGEVLKYEGSDFSAWLRSINFEDQAEFVDDVGREITGAASDTILAFSQILNAFSIDEEAIDSMAKDIDCVTVDLSKGSFTR